MAIAIATKEQIEQVVCQVGEIFKLMVLGKVDHFLWLQIVRDRKLKMIQITQEPYIEKVLTGRGWLRLNRAATLLNPHMKYDLDLLQFNEKENKEFLELVGSSQ